LGIGFTPPAAASKPTTGTTSCPLHPPSARSQCHPLSDTPPRSTSRMCHLMSDTFVHCTPRLRARPRTPSFGPVRSCDGVASKRLTIVVLADPDATDEKGVTPRSPYRSLLVAKPRCGKCHLISDTMAGLGPWAGVDPEGPMGGC